MFLKKFSINMVGCCLATLMIRWETYLWLSLMVRIRATTARRRVLYLAVVLSSLSYLPSWSHHCHNLSPWYFFSFFLSNASIVILNYRILFFEKQITVYISREVILLSNFLLLSGSGEVILLVWFPEKKKMIISTALESIRLSKILQWTIFDAMILLVYGLLHLSIDEIFQ